MASSHHGAAGGDGGRGGGRERKREREREREGGRGEPCGAHRSAHVALSAESVAAAVLSPALSRSCRGGKFQAAAAGRAAAGRHGPERIRLSEPVRKRRRSGLVRRGCAEVSYSRRRLSR